MSLPVSSIEALRAFLHEDSDGLDRATARMRLDGTTDDFSRAMAGAMLVLLERRIGPTPTLADIVSLTARLRADHRIDDDFDVHPLTTEKLIRAGYGDADAIAGLDRQDLSNVQLFLVTSLAADEQLDDAGIEALIADIRRRV